MSIAGYFKAVAGMKGDVRDDQRRPLRINKRERLCAIVCHQTFETEASKDSGASIACLSSSTIRMVSGIIPLPHILMRRARCMPSYAV